MTHLHLKSSYVYRKSAAEQAGYADIRTYVADVIELPRTSTSKVTHRVVKAAAVQAAEANGRASGGDAIELPRTSSTKNLEVEVQLMCSQRTETESICNECHRTATDDHGQDEASCRRKASALLT